MGQTADQLRQELDRKREELTKDVDRIEERVMSAFDINHQVEQKPLLAVGLAVAGGFLLGSMVGGGSSKPKYEVDRRYSRGSYAGPGAYTGGQSIYSQPAPFAAQGHTNAEQQHAGGPSLIGNVAEGVKESFRRGSGGSTVEDTVSNVTAAITAILVDKAKEMLDQNLPGFADKYEQARQRGVVGGSADDWTTGNGPASSASSSPYSAGSTPGEPLRTATTPEATTARSMSQ